MARQVLTSKDLKRSNESGRPLKGASATTTSDTKDEYFDRLLKYIPAEVVVCYIFVTGLIQKLSGPVEMTIFQWSIFVIFCFLTILYLMRVLKVKKVQQLAISLIAFVVWVFALGGPFTQLAWYNPVYGEILLPIYTLVIAIWEAE
jgi:hypothetical protein